MDKRGSGGDEKQYLECGLLGRWREQVEVRVEQGGGEDRWMEVCGRTEGSRQQQQHQKQVWFAA